MDGKPFFFTVLHCILGEWFCQRDGAEHSGAARVEASAHKTQLRGGTRRSYEETDGLTD